MKSAFLVLSAFLFLAQTLQASPIIVINLNLDVEGNDDQVSFSGTVPDHKSNSSDEAIHSYTPCANGIVFAVDNSAKNQYFKESKAFLTETVLNKFNHTERLGLVFYSKKAEKAVDFNDLADDTDKNINYAKNLIQSQTQALHGRPSLMKLFQELLVNYQPNNDNSEISHIVFVSELEQKTIDAVKPLADQLNTGGRHLALIALGNIDPKNTLLKQLTSNYVQWSNPSVDAVLPKWKEFFWTSAYGCQGASRL